MATRKRVNTRPIGLPRGAVVVRLGKVYDRAGVAGEVAAFNTVTANGNTSGTSSTRTTCADCAWSANVIVTHAPDGSLYVTGGQSPAVRLATHRRGETCRRRQEVNRLVDDGWQKVAAIVLRDALLEIHRRDRRGEGDFWEVTTTTASEFAAPEVWASKRVCELFASLVTRFGPTLDVPELVSFLFFAQRVESEACERAWPGEGILRLYRAAPEMRRAELARALGGEP